MVEPYRFFNKPKPITKIIRKMPEVKFSLLVMCTTFIAITLGMYYYKIYTCTSGTMDTEEWNPDKCFIYPEKSDDDDDDVEYDDEEDENDTQDINETCVPLTEYNNMYGRCRSKNENIQNRQCDDVNTRKACKDLKDTSGNDLCTFTYLEADPADERTYLKREFREGDTLDSYVFCGKCIAKEIGFDCDRYTDKKDKCLSNSKCKWSPNDMCRGNWYEPKIMSEGENQNTCQKQAGMVIEKFKQETTPNTLKSRCPKSKTGYNMVLKKTPQKYDMLFKICNYNASNIDEANSGDFDCWYNQEMDAQILEWVEGSEKDKDNIMSEYPWSETHAKDGYTRRKRCKSDCEEIIHEDTCICEEDDSSGKNICNRVRYSGVAIPRMDVGNEKGKNCDFTGLDLSDSDKDERSRWQGYTWQRIVESCDEDGKDFIETPSTFDSTPPPPPPPPTHQCVTRDEWVGRFGTEAESCVMYGKGFENEPVAQKEGCLNSQFTKETWIEDGNVYSDRRYLCKWAPI